MQVTEDRNFDFVAKYIATFLGESSSLPRKIEVEDSTALASIQFERKFYVAAL